MRSPTDEILNRAEIRRFDVRTRFSRFQGHNSWILSVIQIIKSFVEISGVIMYQRGAT